MRPAFEQVVAGSRHCRAEVTKLRRKLGNEPNSIASCASRTEFFWRSSPRHWTLHSQEMRRSMATLATFSRRSRSPATGLRTGRRRFSQVCRAACGSIGRASIGSEPRLRRLSPFQFLDSLPECRFAVDMRLCILWRKSTKETETIFNGYRPASPVLAEALANEKNDP
jgi:hypothetical protein